MERVIKQHGVWWSVIKAVPAVKAAVALEEDEGRWRTLHFVCGGLFPQADCIGKDKRHSTYIKQNSCDAIAVLRSKKKSIHKYLSKILVVFVILIITFSVQLSVMHFVVLDS